MGNDAGICNSFASMASAMASLATGATFSGAFRTPRASKRAISHGQRLAQSSNAGIVFAIRSPIYGAPLLSSLPQLKSASACRLSRMSVSSTSSIVCVAASDDSGARNGASIATALVSRAILVATVVAHAVVRAAKALTATPLPNGVTDAERELVTALKGRLVLAAGPLFFAAISQTPGSVSTPLTVVASGMAKWLELYSGVLMVRVLLSWFPNIPWERQPLQAVRDMCDPYLNLFRNIIPPLFNALDLSPMLAFMVLGVLTSILNTTAR